MKTASCKSKGRRLAQRVREKLLSYRPDLPPQDVKVTSSGETGPDLQFSDRACKDIGDWAIECKNVEKLNIWEALKQSESHASVGLWGKTPLLVFSRNHCDDYITLKLDDFLKLVM